MHRVFIVFSDFRVPLGIIVGPRGDQFRELDAKFCGGAPGSFLDAFWLPFGRLLGAFWEPWGHLWETLRQFWQPWGQLWGRLLGCGRLGSLWQDFSHFVNKI